MIRIFSLCANTKILPNELSLHKAPTKSIRADVFCHNVALATSTLPILHHSMLMVCASRTAHSTQTGIVMLGSNLKNFFWQNMYEIKSTGAINLLHQMGLVTRIIFRRWARPSARHFMLVRYFLADFVFCCIDAVVVSCFSVLQCVCVCVWIRCLLFFHTIHPWFRKWNNRAIVCSRFIFD